MRIHTWRPEAGGRAVGRRAARIERGLRFSAFRCRASLSLLLAASLLVLPGCGRPTYTVTGKVVLSDGTPLSAGQVEFQHLDEPVSAVGYIRPDGTFGLNMNAEGDGAFEGRYRVAVKPPPVPTMVPGQDEKARQDLAARQAWLDAVDERYYNPKTSGIDVEVTRHASKNAVTITIEP